jgi:hypothetical protein
VHSAMLSPGAPARGVVTGVASTIVM